MLNLSNAGAEFISRWEGFSAAPYQDVAGHWTVGYGHLIRPGESFTRILTQGEALDLLMEDATRNAGPVAARLLYPVAQHQADAIISLAYNVGGYAVANSTLLRLLNASLPDVDVASQFLRWNRAGGRVVRGLVKRRAAERRLFLNADYSGAP